MKNLPFFLAWRYLIGSKSERSISAMIVVCLLGIFIGSFALAVVASVMNGFEKATHATMQGIHSQIIMHAEGQLINTNKIINVLKEEFPSIKACSPSGSEQALIQHQETEDVQGIVIIKGIDPDHEPFISNLHNKVTDKTKELSSLLSGKNVLIGEKLAEQIEAKKGDPVTLLISSDNESRGRKIKLITKRVLISETFKTGIDEFDSGFIFCSLALLKKIFPGSGATQLGIKLHEKADENATIAALKKRLKLNVYSWKDLYPALVSALKLEKYVMFLILALITLVASMNIISLMFMQITRKRSDIAILKSMGMTNKSIARTFLWMGIIVSFISSIVGLTCAFGVGWVLENYPFITLPDAYYVSHLPSKMTPSIFLTVFIVVMLISFISTWLAVRRTKSINISQVLRFEG